MDFIQALFHLGGGMLLLPVVLLVVLAEYIWKVIKRIKNVQAIKTEKRTNETSEKG